MRALIGGLFFCLLNATAMAEAWSCKNDMEIQCALAACEVSENFTPMDITLNMNGMISVCAYSGCFEGKSTVLQNEPYLVFAGHNLAFSSSSNNENKGTALVSVDRSNGIGFIKMGTFAQPLICSKS